jgi:23S rRNA (uracil1939-C5)-methyltransferase
MKGTFPIVIEGIAHDGAARGTHDGNSVRVHGMLPSESGVVEAHTKHGVWVGALKELTKASPSRKLPEETHYLACSPWQVMEYPLQAELKKGILEELFSYYQGAPKAAFVTADKFLGYRTKIEFSFCDRDATGAPAPLSLAFHERGAGERRIALPEGCALATAPMNTVALEIVKRLRESGVAASQLKTLIIRESKANGKLLALLYAKDEKVPPITVDDITGLSGFIAMYSTEKSPASVATKELWRWGSDVISEKVGGLDVSYSWDSFFQNNLPMFEHAMTNISHAASLVPDATIIELYSGVGTIGLLLARKARSVHGLEVISAAVEHANTNAKANGISNYRALATLAEKIDESVLDGADILVLDPPRAGLHKNVLTMIKNKLPRRIIYLSCNPVTQARDYSELAEHYRIDSLTGYDFYPQTPHLESLLVLSRKN